jgi:hypothetical protein
MAGTWRGSVKYRVRNPVGVEKKGAFSLSIGHGAGQYLSEMMQIRVESSTWVVSSAIHPQGDWSAQGAGAQGPQEGFQTQVISRSKRYEDQTMYSEGARSSCLLVGERRV